MSEKFKPIRSLFDIPREEMFVSGHRLCAGCTVGPVMRLLTKIAGKDAIIVNATGCLEVASAAYPYTSWRHPWIHVAFENAAAVASGVEAAIKVLKRKGVLPEDKEIKVIVVGGDGGTFDIGIQALSGMLERGHDVLYVCYDNEAYMNTGIQRSAATPYGAWTTTTPVGKKWLGEWRPKKDLISIALAHNIPYAATANPYYILDMVEKFRKALDIKGPKVIHVFSPCVPGWRIDPSKSMEVAKLAVQTGVWINYEVENGVFRVTTPVPKRKPVIEYLKLQGRFKHLLDKPEEIAKIQRMVDEQVEKINKLVGRTVIGPVEG
jgi:pyruvate ferredoxin oxidoreductase beta subunit